MLAYECFGTGEPLVLVHGISHRRQAWYPVAEQLAEHREVVLFALPGHGESPEIVTDGRADDVAGVVDLLLLGSSHGLRSTVADVA
jgi:pimeloyl-ACP methyl ester carboxylesterase